MKNVITELQEVPETDAPEVYPILRQTLERTLIKAYNISKNTLPFYPTVDEIDDLLESDQFLYDPWVREDTFKMFVLCIISGFTKDKAWHTRNPGKRHVTMGNLYAYLTTPYDGKDSYIPHINIWNSTADDDTKEDMQAAFDYMQSVILDPAYFTIVDRRARKSALSS